MPCAIDFVFEDPQDIMAVEVSFYKGDERSRTVEVSSRDGSRFRSVYRLRAFVFVFVPPAYD